MAKKIPDYTAIISSDWNECLAPCGPFDPLAFNFPGLSTRLATIFRQYTGNAISLGAAADRIRGMLPSPLTEERMDAYLDASFQTYKGAPDLIEWCLGKQILFMINTTGAVGYFQRVFAKGLFPPIPALSAHPMTRYGERKSDPPYIYDLLEIRDKGKNTEKVVRALNIPLDKIILMGDSGGDGPHFEWGARANAFLIGSMTKASLATYCRERGVEMDLRVGPSYAPREERDPGREARVNLMDLTDRIEAFLDRRTKRFTPGGCKSHRSYSQSLTLADK
ncbi:MAG: hypothetical protein GY859_41600 [Desulfobacterales bacterium]|nr:hypothetical protein [Desulfobacterales bacterium]